MNETTEPGTEPSQEVTAASADIAAPSTTFSIPARHNPRLQSLVERINADEELWQLWRCANINAVDRLGMSDHGEVHIRNPWGRSSSEFSVTVLVFSLGV